MNYNELKELAESKNILLKTICDKVGYTRAGLRPAIDNETIDLRKLKILCELLGIAPAKFFESGTYGNTEHVKINNESKMIIENKDKEIYMLRDQLADKKEIIRMLREKLDLGIAANPKSTYKKD